MRYLFLIICCMVWTAGTSQNFMPRYELVKIQEVNSSYHDAAPIISPDGKKLYFFVANHPSNTNGISGSQDIWLSKIDENGVWSAPEHLGSPFNQSKTNQVFQVMADGSLLVRGGRSKDKLGFSIVSPGGSWQELKIKDFDEMAKGRFNGATISADLKHMVLYFSEYKSAVKSDLYVTHEQGGSWSRPVKLKLSNSTDEFAPFIAPDNKTLYFVSDRLSEGRQGGADIHKSTRLDDTWNNWSPAVNVGGPVNTAASDDYFSMDAKGNVYTARANSRRDGGNLDIFILTPVDIKVRLAGTVFDEKTNAPLVSAVTLIVNEKPVEITTPASGKFEAQIEETDSYQLNVSSPGYHPREIKMAVPPLSNDTTLVSDVFLTPVEKKLMITGTVYNKKTNEPMGAKVDFTLNPEKQISYSITADAGKYQLEIGKTGQYILAASASGFLATTDSIDFASEDSSPFTKDLYMEPIEVGLTVRLKNIYFDFNKTTLKAESFVELKKVVDFMEQNPSIEVEIAGHTDSKGTDEYNGNLSQGRSQSVVDYIVDQGISASRLTAKGYGESKPIDTNDTPDGQANNRRVEVTILKK